MKSSKKRAKRAKSMTATKMNNEKFKAIRNAKKSMSTDRDKLLYSHSPRRRDIINIKIQNSEGKDDRKKKYHKKQSSTMSPITAFMH